MKYRKNILKEATILLICVFLVLSTTAVTAHVKNFDNEITELKTTSSDVDKNTVVKPITMGESALYEDGFETYEDFLTDFPPWTNIDVDEELTWGHSAFNFTHEGEAYAFMTFNPSSCDPPQTDPELLPHTGDKYVVCWAVQNTLQNDDWLITPFLDPENFNEVSFWAKSYSDQYNIERIEVGVSTTDTDPSSFTIISSSPYIEPPLEWTQYTFDINDYEYQSIYIGIHCVSYDSWFLMVDDFMVTEGDPPVPDICCEGELVWADVEPGATVNATFEISNCGEEGSILDWQFDSAPEWGVWEIEPDSGTDLAEGDSVTITVNVTAPENKSEEFTGKIRMINSDNSSDYCEVDVSLTTPKSKAFNFYVNVQKWLLDRFPKAFPIIGHILGL